MTAAIAYPTSLHRTSIGVLAVGAIAAVVALGALALRAPDQALFPDMADLPVSMAGGQALFVQRFEVTIAEWNACAARRACTLELRARQNQDPATTPATGLSYVDALEYIAWINRETGHDFRLPTAAEWDAMAAAVLPEKPEPICTDPALAWASGYLTEGRAPRALKPQGSFSTSPEGVADLDGSVWEWTQDCYAGTAEDPDPARCAAFVLGGEHAAVMPFLTRDPANGGCAVGTPPAHLGLRLVSDKAT